MPFVIRIDNTKLADNGTGQFAGVCIMRAFGELLRSLREDGGFGLREFAGIIGEKPSNLSVVENGNRAPWTCPKKLQLVAEKLELLNGSPEWVEFFAAARKPDQLPADVQIMGNRKLVPGSGEGVGTEF